MYFSKVPSPFDVAEVLAQRKKKKESSNISKIDIVECAYNFLKSDVTFYKSAWQWSTFIEQYCNGKPTGDHTYHLICNNILALLANMTNSQLQTLNKDIPTETVIDFQLKYSPQSTVTIKSEQLTETEGNVANEKFLWNFSNETLTNIEGVTLPIFDKTNYRFFAKHEAAGELEKIVRVDSTKINLRSLALGVAAGKAICLAGPVGCGKTALVEYLARQTGRIAPKFVDVERIASFGKPAAKENTNINGNGKKGAQKKSKRKREDIEDKDPDDALLNELYKKAPTNGFLRIQLGDQTDSKMLLGQYRCTDVPGEFVWQPGVLTQVNMAGNDLSIS